MGEFFIFIDNFNNNILTFYLWLYSTKCYFGGHKGCSVLSYISHFGDSTEAAEGVGVAVLAD
jgi:hypothetical protein